MTLLLQLPASVPQMEITEVFADAIVEASKLCAEDQNYLAFRIMEEIAEEKKWSDSFSRSQNLLKKMADEARAEYERGETIPSEAFLATIGNDPCKD